jgi:hypothetical protein
MRRVLMTFALAVIAVMAGAISARADTVYHSQHIALAPTGAAPLRSGFVENIHADGPNVFAHEQYVVNGARPNTSYQVVLMAFPGDTTCSASPITIPTAMLATNTAGNGNAYHVFTPADAEGLHGLTLGGKWLLMNGNTVEYATSCATIRLD